jgi:hypothetical protein
MLMIWDSFRLNVSFNEQPKVSPASKADAPGQIGPAVLTSRVRSGIVPLGSNRIAERPG